MKLISVLFLYLALYSQAHASLFITKNIASDEHVVFFPALAHYDREQKQWIAELHGWIFEPDPAADIKSLTLRLFKKIKNPEQIYFKRLMKKRIQWFFVDNERNKIIRIRLDKKIYVLKKSGPNGHFYGQIKLSEREVKNLPLNRSNRINYNAVTPEHDQRIFRGTIEFIKNRGISVISDIDDTIKHTAVHNKRELLKNTFSRPFQPIPGMAESYRRWAREQQVTFHYVTASPWQLYVPLTRFMTHYRFPAGSLHMKYFRFTDRSFLNIFRNSVQYKIAEITKLIKRYPLRQFVLVGDSGENDLDIYSKIAARYPQRVRAIYIHETAANPINKAQTKKRRALKSAPPIIMFNTQKKAAHLPFH